jgi:hypothetical protein
MLINKYKTQIKEAKQACAVLANDERTAGTKLAVIDHAIREGAKKAGVSLEHSQGRDYMLKEWGCSALEEFTKKHFGIGPTRFRELVKIANLRSSFSGQQASNGAFREAAKSSKHAEEDMKQAFNQKPKGEPVDRGDVRKARAQRQAQEPSSIDRRIQAIRQHIVEDTALEFDPMTSKQLGDYASAMRDGINAYHQTLQAIKAKLDAHDNQKAA